MKKELNPAAMVGIIVLAVALIAVFGYHMLQPAPYAPSPGGPGASGKVPGAPPQSAAATKAFPSAGTSSHASTYYPVAPPGSIPGKPLK